MNKKQLMFYLISGIILATAPVQADIIWPSIYIAKGMLSIKVILTGLIVELLFVKYCTRINWINASITTILMNLITCILGVALIPFSGLGVELVFDLVFHAYDKFGIGSFHWSHWLVSYLLIIFINTFIECLYIKLTLKLCYRKTFWWMLVANGISVFLCFLFYGTNT